MKGKFEEFTQKLIHNKKRATICIIVIAVLLILYLAGTLFYRSHFLPRTEINGVSYSNAGVEAAGAALKEREKSYRLKLTDLEGKSEEIKAEAVDLNYKGDSKLDKIMSGQNEWSWIVALFRPSIYENVVFYNYDQNKLAALKPNLNVVRTANTRQSANAQPVYEKGKIIIKAAVQGNTIDQSAFDRTLDQKLSCGIEELNMKDDGCYVEPAYTKYSKEVRKAKAAMEKSLGAIVTYEFDSAKEIIDKDRIGSWLTVDDKMAAGFNQELMNRYLTELAGKYETKSDSTIHTIDKPAEIAALIPILKEGKPVTRKPVFTDVSIQSSSGSNARIDVNLSTQTLTLYINGAVDMTTPIVSGCVADGNSTATGVYKIYSKATDTYLQGPTWYDYVNYWMAYDAANANGIHDADGWRSEYGGTIYKENGSHGCVNVPVWAAARIYNTCDIGTEVNIHW